MPISHLFLIRRMSSQSLICTPKQYLIETKNCEAPCYALFFVPLLLHLSKYFFQPLFLDFFSLTQNKHPFDLFRGPSAAPFLSAPISYIFLAREEWKNKSLNFFNMYLLLFTSLSPPGGMWTWGLFNLSKQVSCSKSTSIYSTEDRPRGKFRDFTKPHI